METKPPVSSAASRGVKSQRRFLFPLLLLVLYLCPRTCEDTAFGTWRKLLAPETLDTGFLCALKGNLRLPGGW